MERFSRWLGILAALALLVGSGAPGPIQAQEPQGDTPQATAGPLGTAFTYQGRLVDDGNPANGVYDLRFTLYDAEVGGSAVGSPITLDDVTIADGLFTVQLDFGSSAFTGGARWLQVEIRPGDSTGTYTVLSPRQPLTATPYALYSRTAPWSGLMGVPPGLGDGDDDTLASLSCTANQVAKWNGTAWTCAPDADSGDITGVNAGTGLTGGGDAGTVTLGLNTSYTDNRYWKQGGNAGTDPSLDFLGTTDDQALEIRVSNRRALRVEPGVTKPSLAAGQRARAIHDGTFVWADGQDADFASTGVNQFLVRAGGGVGIDTNAPKGKLHVSANSTTGYPTLRLEEQGGDYARLEFANTANTARRWHVAGLIGNSLAADRLNIWNSAGGDVMSITGNGLVGIGTTSPQTPLDVRAPRSGGSGVPGYGNFVAWIENTTGACNPTCPQGMGIKVRRSGNLVGTSFIVFYDADNTRVGAVEGNSSGGVTYYSSSGDFAEWLPLRDPTAEEQIRPGDIVAWTPQGISLETREALRLMVVSTAPILAGNTPATEDLSGWVPVAFVGQVPVRVRGPVQVGDLILPSGRDDGTGIAVSPTTITADQMAQVVGWALETAAGEGIHTVQVLVGLPDLALVQTVLAARDSRIASLEERLTALEARLDALASGAEGR